MGSLPFSAPRPRSLPTASTSGDLDQTLAIWKTQLAPLVARSAPQPPPQNFTITNSRGGLTLAWSPLSSKAGADGYEILKSTNGSFTDDLQIIPVKNVNQSSFFDGVGGNAQTAHYRLRTTSGSAANPQAQRGPESGVIKHTSIDASDTTSVPVTMFDNYTTDKVRSGARLGNYGAIKVSPLGQSGGSLAGSGAKGGAGTSTGRPAASATSFASLGTGKNTKGTLIVGAGASVIPDSSNPGIIAATQAQGTDITTTPPQDGQLLQYSAQSGELVYASIIGTGTQANLSSVLPLAIGEIYVATDTGNLFIGTPGVGAGYIQVGDMSQVNDLLLRLLAEMKAVRLALTKIACDGGGAVPADFDPQNLMSDPEIGA